MLPKCKPTPSPCPQTLKDYLLPLTGPDSEIILVMHSTDPGAHRILAEIHGQTYDLTKAVGCLIWNGPEDDAIPTWDELVRDGGAYEENGEHYIADFSGEMILQFLGNCLGATSLLYSEVIPHALEIHSIAYRNTHSASRASHSPEAPRD